MKFFSLCMVISCIFITVSTSAKSISKKNYVRADVIWSVPTKSIIPENNGKPNAAIAGGTGVGYCLSDNFKGDITATFRHYKHDSHISKQNLDNTSFIASAYLIKNHKIVDYYLMVGMGISFNKTGNFFDKTNGLTILGSTVSNFAWQVGIGTMFRVEQNFYIDLMYKYANLGETRTKDVSCGPHATSGGCAFIGDQRNNIKNHEISAGIIFKF